MSGVACSYFMIQLERSLEEVIWYALTLLQDPLEKKNEACRNFFSRLNESVLIWGRRLPVDARYMTIIFLIYIYHLACWRNLLPKFHLIAMQYLWTETISPDDLHSQPNVYIKDMFVSATFFTCLMLHGDTDLCIFCWIVFLWDCL